MQRKSIYLGAFLLCFFLIFAFHFEKNGIHWFWTGKEIVPVISGLFALILGWLWFSQPKNKASEN